ncbi:DNA-binding transcriptional regulator Fis [Halospina denitrificans]|nr:DNA-binding transcriptional regulator Fis [Halospina denitrificans]
MAEDQQARQTDEPLTTATGNGQTVTLRDSVEHALENYFSQLDGAPVTDVYQLVLSEVEAPLLEKVMEYTSDNQTRASAMLGLNRGTLRKKLKQYGLL